MPIAAMLIGALSPAEARPRQPEFFAPLEDLFGARPRARRAKPIRVAIPLPQARPAEAPLAPTPPLAGPVPLPQVRPAEPKTPILPAPIGETPAVPLPEPRPAEVEKADVPLAPQPPSACRLALTDEIAIAPSIPDIVGPGNCGSGDLVRLEAVVLRDKTRVSLKPAATLRCEMATAVAEWMREDIPTLAQDFGAMPQNLDNFDSFDCRGRNRVAGAKTSEHGYANALDMRGFTLANGISINLTEKSTARDLREKVLRSVCARFSTVLGPGSDGYHEDHIHLDLAQRRSGYRICQWNVLDPMPAIAPAMPEPRPEDAPPRPEAAKAGDADDTKISDR